MVQSLGIDFAKNSYKTRGVQNSVQRLLNFYAEPNPQDNKAPYCLYGTPGTTIKYDLEVDNPIYGMQQMADNLYVVSGVDVFKIDLTGTITNIGSLTGAPGRVSLANNGTQLFILDSSGDGFIATSSSVTKITDPDYQKASSVTYVDSYFLLSVLDSDQFFISDEFDGLVYDALDFATAEWEPDKLVRVITFNGQVWLLGTDTTEVYLNSGAADFPFQRITNVSLEEGCSSKFSVVKDSEYLMWLGSDRMVYLTTGYKPTAVTTYPIVKEFESYTKKAVENSFAFIYTQDGHKFYVLSFPDANKTWVYDITTNLWHERGSLNINKEIVELNANAFEFYNSENLIGDNKRGLIYKLDLDTYTENGETIISEAVSITNFNNTNRTIINRFRLDAEVGVGLTTGQGSDPEIMMQWSKDGGKTYSSELWRKLGKIGKYNTRVVWRRLGLARNIVFKLRISDPVKRAIFQPFVDIEAGEP